MLFHFLNNALTGVSTYFGNYNSKSVIDLAKTETGFFSG